MPWEAPTTPTGEPLPPLVAVDDYAEWHSLGSVSDLPADQQNRIEMALEIASSFMRATRSTGPKVFTAIDNEPVTVDGSGATILLLPPDRLPVRGVASVVEDGTTLDAADYEWSAAGMLKRSSGVWTAKFGGVVVTYSHGYAVLPRALAGVCMAIAKRILDAPDGQGGGAVQSETVGSYSVTFAAPSSAGVGLTELEAKVLARL